MTAGDDKYDDANFTAMYLMAFGGEPPDDYARYHWSSLSPDEKQLFWNMMIETINKVQQQMEREAQKSVAEFEDHITALMSSGGIDRETALQWVMFGSRVEEGNWTALERELGLPRGYLTQPHSFPTDK